MILSRCFYNWERRLAASTTDRVVRPFEWGLDWLGPFDFAQGMPLDDTQGRLPAADLNGGSLPALERFVDATMADTQAFYATSPAPAYDLDSRGVLRFDSALRTPHEANNVVHARYFPAENGRRQAAVILLPHWNSDAEGHVGLSRLLTRFGMSALRLSLPYHDIRMPSELHRADYIVSANVGRTLQVCRQAVLDAKRAVYWLAARGYREIGILGTSLGSCLSMLTAAHEPLIRAAALNHISPFFADVVWEGLSTVHVRQGLDGHVTLDILRRLWLPISPQAHLDRMRNTETLLVYARYDLTFPVALSRRLVADFARLKLPHQVVVLPCGHYSTGLSPFKWLDGYVLTKFLKASLHA
jgi:hypothetical protein